ncbi:hypothetical protein [Haloarcula salina]|uniref:Uncharacterized protein n=1 Tax=Haloarcula salina TaxID=1429914 RepID=A0AA41G5C6_9EURY|nr:hypothetical protein [Haloarcula salina]MBV0903919.1 hypothetical protein [Haloarcula salina]
MPGATTLSRYQPWYEAGNKKPIPASAMAQATVVTGTEITVFAKQVAQDEILMHGHGSHLRDIAEAFVGLDLVASGNGSGTAGDDIQGDVVLAITNSDQTRVLADVELDSLDQLRDSLSESRTDRIVEELMTPYAKPGRHLEVRIRAESGSDGVEIDPSASSGQLYYTQIDA